MRAIILAAGSAKRLRPLTGDRPKCMLEVGGVPILRYQLSALEACGVKAAVAVTGWHAETFEAFARRLTLVHNEDYATTNSLYSFWLCGDHLEEGILLLNSDVLFGPELLDLLLGEPSPDALLVDPEAELDAEAMKVEVADGRVAAMSKDLPLERAFGENLGVIKLSPEGARALWDAGDRAVRDGHLRAWLPYGIDMICGERRFEAVSSGGRSWIEIDTPQDLERAEREIRPRLEL
jgi:choline kinase